MFEATLDNYTILRKTLEAVKEIADDVNLSVNNDAFYFQVSPFIPSH